MYWFDKYSDVLISQIIFCFDLILISNVDVDDDDGGGGGDDGDGDARDHRDLRRWKFAKLSFSFFFSNYLVCFFSENERQGYAFFTVWCVKTKNKKKSLASFASSLAATQQHQHLKHRCVCMCVFVCAFVCVKYIALIIGE